MAKGQESTIITTFILTQSNLDSGIPIAYISKPQPPPARQQTENYTRQTTLSMGEDKPNYDTGLVLPQRAAPSST